MKGEMKVVDAYGRLRGAGEGKVVMRGPWATVVTSEG